MKVRTAYGDTGNVIRTETDVHNGSLFYVLNDIRDRNGCVIPSGGTGIMRVPADKATPLTEN